MSESTPFKLDFSSQQGDLDGNSEPSLTEHADLDSESEMASKSRSRRNLKDVSLLLSITGNIVALVVIFILLLLPSFKASDPDRAPLSVSKEENPLDIAIPGIHQNVWMPVRFGWAYYAETVDDMDQVERNWNAINPDLGVVAVPHKVLQNWGIVESQSLPSNSSMGMQTLRAYHSLHCLKIIRQTLNQLINGDRDLEVTIGHVMHCLASLVEDVICYADTSMPFKGPYPASVRNSNASSGYEYMRMCRNWSAMREWATERTACITTSLNGVLDIAHEYPENCARGDGIQLPQV